MNGTSWTAFREAERRDPHDVPGHGRPGGIDDPVPDREYGDREKPPGGFPPDADPVDRCDLCDELGAETPATVQLPDVTLTLGLCPGCVDHLEESGRTLDPARDVDDDDDRHGPGRTYRGP